MPSTPTRIADLNTIATRARQLTEEAVARIDAIHAESTRTQDWRDGQVAVIRAALADVIAPMHTEANAHREALAAVIDGTHTAATPDAAVLSAWETARTQIQAGMGWADVLQDAADAKDTVMINALASELIRHLNADIATGFGRRGRVAEQRTRVTATLDPVVARLGSGTYRAEAAQRLQARAAIDVTVVELQQATAVARGDNIDQFSLALARRIAEQAQQRATAAGRRHMTPLRDF